MLTAWATVAFLMSAAACGRSLWAWLSELRAVELYASEPGAAAERLVPPRLAVASSGEMIAGETNAADAGLLRATCDPISNPVP